MWYKAAILPLLLVSICFSQTPRSLKASCDANPQISNNGDVSQRGSTKNYKKTSFYPNFSNNPAITPDMRLAMEPHLLPLNHRMKPILDSIFTASRATESKNSLKKAGFTIVFAQKKSLIIVAKHPRVPGYLFKIFTDAMNVSKKGKVGWQLYTTRCVVAKKIRKIIKRRKLHRFIVADKWIYPLPVHPKSHYTDQEPVILLVKDMRIYSKHRSKHMWKTKTRRATLRQLYAILGRGYGSAFLSNNVPYTKRGKYAFIDTEYDKRKISLWLVNHFLSRKMQHYWDKILRKHEPPPQPSPNVMVHEEA